MTPAEINSFVKEAADDVGFDRCGIAKPEPIGREVYLRRWLQQGLAGSMGYLHRNLDKRIDPATLLPGARSAIVVALNYKQSANQFGDREGARIPNRSRDREGAVAPDGARECSHGWSKAEPVDCGNPEDFRPGRGGGTRLERRGRIAMYAWGDDYHDVLRDKLRELETKLRAQVAEPFDCRICVDTAPILERELAAAAGVGWIGKNTMAIHPELGSFFFLGIMLTTLDIAPDEPLPDHCGTCTACLDACPTQAFFAPYRMDASRCISYLTIEHRGDISRPFQEMMGDWLFGCDVCQDICPHNRKAPDTREPRFAPREPSPAASLQEVLAWSEQEYRDKTSQSAMSRAKLDMLKRNARIALENDNKKNCTEIA